MAAETSCIRNVGCQSWMRILRVLTDMAGQTATAAIPHYIVTVFSFFLSDMATRTLLAQHRIRNTVPERLKVNRFIRTGVFVEQLSSNPNDASSVMHQVIRNGSNSVVMTVSAATLRIGQFSGKIKQAFVRAVLCGCRVVPGMAANAIICCKSMCRTEPVLFVRMTKQACAFYRFLSVCTRHELQRYGNNGEHKES